MILRTDLIQECCNIILQAISSMDLVNMPENLELKVADKELSILVATNSYNVMVKKPVLDESTFTATVKAQLFLKLISQITSETITINNKDKFIEVVANGTYKLPIIMENDSMLVLPRLNLGEVATEFDIESTVLHNICTYNSIELAKGFVSSPVSKLYYMDEKGCITFTPNSACINNFTLAKETKVFLPTKVVNLFKLFKDSTVHYQLGKNDKYMVEFSGKEVTIISIIENPETLLSNIPAINIRAMADTEFENSVVMDKVRLRQAIERLTIFNKSSLQQLIRFTFTDEGINISDIKNKGVEKLPYINDVNLDMSIILDYKDLKLVLDCYPESHITFNFNEDSPVVVKKDSIFMVICPAEEI